MGNLPRSDRRALCIIICLILLVGAVYRPSLDYGFLGYDDDLYVFDNPRVAAGPTWRGAVWAMGSFQAANWHPLTWLSHMLDVRLFGLDARGHHLVNLLLHAANASLLFVALAASTSALWPAALAAALFAVHPLRVESVVWLAERKDVLSGFFWMLTLLAYIRYLRRPGLGRYLPVVALCALGLMAKPMLVTLPFVLLLFDGWPFNRWRFVPGLGGGRPWCVNRWRPWGLLLEKAPLLLLSAASSYLTIRAQAGGGAVKSLERFPLLIRAANALRAYLLYAWKTVRPLDLSIFYRHPGNRFPLWQGAAAGVVLLLITLALLRQWRRRPYLAVGWLGYLGMLVPVIGLVQVGSQAMADRYAYLPLIGLFIMASWGLLDPARGHARASRRAAALAAAVVLAALAILSRAQVRHWRSGESLFRHAVEIDPENASARSILGVFLQRGGKIEQAEGEYRLALALNPLDSLNLYFLGNCLAAQRRPTEAEEAYRRSIRLNPSYAWARNNLGMTLLKLGRPQEAISQFREALRLDPPFVKARINLGNALIGAGLYREGRDEIAEAVRMQKSQAP